MNLEAILADWAIDSQIDYAKLDISSVETPKLHAKYLELLTNAKLKLKDLEFKQQVLLKKKFLWYNGKLSREEVEELGWDPDPFNGLKIMKGDMKYYYDSDPEIQDSERKIVYFKEVIDTLKEIMESVKWRHQTIRNIIQWKQFEAGY